MDQSAFGIIVTDEHVRSEENLKACARLCQALGPPAFSIAGKEQPFGSHKLSQARAASVVCSAPCPCAETGLGPCSRGSELSLLSPEQGRYIIYLNKVSGMLLFSEIVGRLVPLRNLFPEFMLPPV